MVKINVAVMAACLTSAVAQFDPKPVRAYAGGQYDDESADFPVDGNCHNVRGWLYRNVQSLDIPCGGPGSEASKTVCTLYSEGDCNGEIVQFDGPHWAMFSRPNDELETRQVGALLASLQCEVMPANTPVSNGNGHQSTQSTSECRNGDYQPPGPRAPHSDDSDGFAGEGLEED